MFCKKCSTRNEIGYFCKECGHKLDIEWVNNAHVPQQGINQKIKSWLGNSVQLIIYAGILLLIFWQPISQWWSDLMYQPSLEMTSVINNLPLTDHGEELLLDTRPQILDRDTFTKPEYCGKNPEDGYTQGCYKEENIFLLKIYNREFKDSMQATAAHELLHAAYDDLPSSERQEIKGSLKKLGNRKEVKKRLQNYANNSPKKRLYEIHAIAGTEIKNVPPHMEKHYRQYFRSRQSIVKIDDKIDNLIAKEKSHLKQLRNQINTVVASTDQIASNANYCARIGNASCYYYNKSLHQNKKRQYDNLHRRFQKQKRKLKKMDRGYKGEMTVDNPNLSEIEFEKPN